MRATLLTLLLLGCGDGIPTDSEYWHPPCSSHNECGPAGLCVYKQVPADALCYQECIPGWLDCEEPDAECRHLNFRTFYCEPPYELPR
jgi:hypothetical protein